MMDTLRRKFIRICMIHRLVGCEVPEVMHGWEKEFRNNFFIHRATKRHKRFELLRRVRIASCNRPQLFNRFLNHYPAINVSWQPPLL
ncbi:unnamed protein product [Darwinula stevensoni]|uniref:Uncharacterized protein n=1 Tax=Darwinula stevensoni TaxID=69355 RepID=A0A7R8XG86_9CRUS|nr:unnamed protein product [Darwinula stevensoni]CAG0896040.1 unnamed protein product [Darwinula stevensoni]